MLANYETYRARIAAAAVAIFNHDVVDAVRELDAAPESLRDWEWRHLHTRLDVSSAVLPAAAGESRFLIRDPKGVRVATWTPVSLRLTDLEGHEVLTRSFRPVSDLSLRFPLPTRQGLRVMAWDGKPAAASPDVAQSEDRTPTVVLLVDDEGHVQTRLKGPPPMHAGPVDLSPDGSRLAVLWMGAKNWVFRLYDPDSGKPVATSAHDFGFCWAAVFSPDGTRIATAGEDGLTTAVGHVHRHDDRSMSRPLAQGVQRRIPPGRPAPADDLGGWDRPPVGFLDGQGARAALRTSHGGSHDGGVQP